MHLLFMKYYKYRDNNKHLTFYFYVNENKGKTNGMFDIS